MAISTYKTYLMCGSTPAKLVDIRNFPDLGSDPEMIDVTTLSDKYRHYILGVLDTGALSFDYNYDATTYAAVDAVCDGTVQNFQVWFGGTESQGTVTPSGAQGKFAFSGYASHHVVGGGVNEGVTGRITIALASDITVTFPS